MSRPRTGVGAELVPLVLILSCLAGSLALIVTVHRRSAAPRAIKPAVAVAPALPPPPARVEAPAPVPVPEPVEEPEPPPPPPVEDPTPKAVARLTSAEAEQLLEASRAERKAAELEAAKQKVDARSAALRQRVALVRSQMDIQETKVRQLEAEADALAQERDALEQERDARKAALANRSRPGTAILPHKGPNGTWRRPVVVECRDGMAILQPRGVPFGLLDLASGFGPASNPFVATVAREAIRVQARSSPDGSPVVPYIFFVIRPDGIRPYYEARGRLEPLGITFGYELVDQDAQIEFPDLDDVNAWDGSSPPPPGGRDPLSDPTPPRRTPGLASSTRAEDEEFPSWQPSGRPSNLGGATPRGTGAIRGGDRTFAPTESSGTGPSPGDLAQLGSPPLPGRSQIAGGGGPPDAPKGSSGTGSTRPGGLFAMAGPEPLPGSLGARPPGGSGSPGGMGRGGSPLLGGSGGGGLGGTGSSAGTSAKPVDNGLDPLGGMNGPADLGAGSGRSTGSRNPGQPGGGAGTDPGADGNPPPTAPGGDKPGGGDETDPGSTFIFPGGGAPGPKGQPGDASGSPPPPKLEDGAPAELNLSTPGATGSTPPPTGPIPPTPVNLGSPLDETAPPGNVASGATQSSSGETASGATSSGSTTSAASGAKSAGQGARPMTGQLTRSPGSSAAGATSTATAAGVGMPTPSFGQNPPPNLDPSLLAKLPTPPASPSRPSPLPDPSTSSVVDRTFEVVIVCSRRGVIVQPGGYRVTADSLQARDGLLKKQVVGVVKARRAEDPRTKVEPRVRFLVQTGGQLTYWDARGQMLLSGLDWPMTTQVADPDPVALLPSEAW